jgi:2,4-dienoyl-CoA reductase-like NADH-dependent reductase (Old Yellow Enzyme family)
MSGQNPTIHTALVLPCGVTVANRLVKGAMTEGLADARNRATDSHVRLYRLWAEGGAGALLTGNVQIDRRYMERPGNVAIDGPQSPEALAALRAYAEAGTRNGTQLWMQISHAGRQTPITVSRQPVAPSDKALGLPGGNFGKPRALTEPEILDIIERFAHAATVARETGFSGVQLHAAHGYLLSEFLSPDVNLRSDDWGGSLANRARLLLESVRAVRRAVGRDFPVGVKLNSADFQRGGFSHEDALEVAQWLDAEGLDYLEISGGTYERPTMMAGDAIALDPARTEHLKASTIAREAYFLEYARDIRAVTKLPLLVTGGFRSVEGMNAALASGATDLIGLARPMCVDTDAPARLLDGRDAVCRKYEDELRLGPGRLLGPASPLAIIKLINGMGAANWFMYQLLEIGRTGRANTDLGLLRAFIGLQMSDRRAAAALVRD